LTSAHPPLVDQAIKWQQKKQQAPAAEADDAKNAKKKAKQRKIHD
jgi:hypothetical protein